VSAEGVCRGCLQGMFAAPSAGGVNSFSVKRTCPASGGLRRRRSSPKIVHLACRPRHSPTECPATSRLPTKPALRGQSRPHRGGSQSFTSIATNQTQTISFPRKFRRPQQTHKKQRAHRHGDMPHTSSHARQRDLGPHSKTSKIIHRNSESRKSYPKDSVSQRRFQKLQCRLSKNYLLLRRSNSDHF
jgi:hypothetical protein